MTIYISLVKRQLDLVDGVITKHSYPVGIGCEEIPTPTGRYWIYDRIRHPELCYQAYDGNTVEVYGTRCLELNLAAYDIKNKVWRPYCIHGTNNPDCVGKATSHGCITMHNGDIEELFDSIERFDKVIIV